MHRILCFIVKTPLRRLIASGVVVLVSLSVLFVLPPFTRESHATITIESGTSVSRAADMLEEAGIIRSSAFFTALIRIFGGSGGVASGTYVFERPLFVFTAAKRLNNGDTGAPLIKVTIPEGSTVFEIADIVSARIGFFDTEAFRALAEPDEGYLFPETYLFPEGASARLVHDTMRGEFNAHIEEVAEEIAASGRSLDDIVIMASLLEKEARLFETRRTVAGILWKRLDMNIPLQVDAVFGYIFGTTTFSPTFDQLRIDSPYNTYTNLGLPPGPIANPGLESLLAAVNPEPSPYLYYLTGADGTMHYAKTFDEHVANRKYLR